MASIPLPESEIRNVNDDTVIIFDIKSPNNGDCDVEIETDNFSEFNDVKSIDSENRSVSGESANNTLLTPDAHSYMSESDTSPILFRKKRPAPQPPNMSPALAARHTYAFDTNALKMRTSTDTESNTSESRLFYQTSTDSESLAIPESARGSNFPGELAGVDNLYSISSLRPSGEDNSTTPRPLSRLGRIREVFRSPQIGRRKTMKEEKGSGEHTPRIRKVKTGDGGSTPVMKRSKVDEGKKLAKVKETKVFDPIPVMSSWIVASGYEDIEIDQEFEVERVLDYEKFLSELLEETDNYHVDYVDISSSLIRVRSMMKGREEEACNEDDALMEAVELRSSQGELSTDSPSQGRADSINTRENSVNNNNNNINTNNNNNNEEQDMLAGRKLSARRKSAPSALLFKSLASMKMRSPTSVWNNNGLGKKDLDVISQFKMAGRDTDRLYITEGSVQLAAGMQIQDRYLFLFSDLLLITKQKSNTTFKLKQKVHLCDMWIASCIDDVSEVTRPAERSFVIGWPTTNVVATFPSVDTKDDWLSKFSQNIIKQKIKEEHKSLQLKVIPKDIDMVTCSSCQLTIDVFTQAKDVVLDCLKQANISDSEAKDYQLWVLSGKDNSPYPLIGHETPYSIKLNQTRDLSRSRSANDLDNMTAADLDTAVENISGSANKCEFYLKQKQTQGKNQFEDSPHHKPMKKHKKTPKIFNTIFRKKRVFGLPLAKICDKNLDPPESIIKLMVLVYQYGPHTSGILRRGNNTLLSKEIKEKINSGDKYNLEDHMAPTAASVFKEFLRNIPDGLLVSSLHEQWLSVKKDDPHEEKINKIKTILAKLPPENYHMLKLTICLLQHLAKHSSVNNMGPSNLATCIAPSLYVHGANGSPQGKWKGGDAQKQMQESVSEIQNVIAPLISFLITYHVELFGEDILTMFVKYGCQASPATSLDDKYDNQMQPSADEEEEEEEMIGDEDDDDDNFSAELTDQHLGEQARPGKASVMRDSNSGTDSDSMHSVLSLQDGGMGLQRDDSSIDSLGDRDFYSHGSPKVTKSHLSPSNLSRDSGLTLSDNQLYDEESYQADIASASAKIFQTKTSNPDQPDLDSCDYNSCRYSMSCQTDQNSSPVPPPRKRSMRRKAYNVSCDGERLGFVEYMSQRPPLQHSISTTYLDESPSSAVNEQRHILQLQSSADKTGLSDSAGKDQEATNRLQLINIQKIRTNVDTLVKPESGSRLYLNEETLPSKFSLEPLEAADESNLRHENSMPLSLLSRHSLSSCDSVISDSIYSTSRDGSINSAPLTPEEPSDLALNWIPDINLPGKPWMNMLLHGTTTAQSQTHSKSTDLHSRDEMTSENPSLDISQTLNSPKLRLRKSHEAEEVHTRNKPHFSLTNESQTDFSTVSSNPFSKTSPSRGNIHYGKQSFSAYLELGSPPPNVILQTLQNPVFKEHAPMTAMGAHLRHSAVDLAAHRHFPFSKAMQSIKLEEYLQVRSTPVIISPEVESSIATAATAAAVKAKLSKYIKTTDPVLSLSKQQVDKPFKYHQVPRSMMKYNEPDDITEKQKEDSARAKAMYEKSLQLYQKEKPLNNQAQNTESNTNVVVSSDLIYAKKLQPRFELEDTKKGRLGNYDYADTTLTNYTPRDSFHSSVMPDDLDDSGASGFLDTGSLSLSLERDIAGGHKPRLENLASSFNRSNSPGNLLSISRNESRLSDTDSLGSSTVTVSTLSSSSDSFNQHSDLSSVTVSSVTSSDSNPEAHSSLPNRRPAGNLHQNCSPRNSSTSEIDIDMMENEDDIDVYPDGLKKDPKQLYLQSMQIYEEKSPRRISTSASQGISSSAIHKGSSASQGVSSSASLGLPSSAAHRASPSTSPQIKKALISHPLSNTPKLQSSPVVPVSSSQKAAVMTTPSAGRPAESKTRLSLDAPSVNLHRSCSDLANHAHKQGSYSSRSAKVGHDDSADAKDNKQSTSSPHSSKETQLKSQAKDVKSEYQQNFLRAKSCFHQAESIRNSLLDTVACHSGQSLQHSPPAQESKPRRRSTSTLSVVTAEPPSAKPPAAKLSTAKPSPANSPATKPPAATPSSVPGSAVPHDQTTDSTPQLNKKEFPWSVKVLKSNFDADKPKDPGYSYSSRNSNESTSQTPSHSCPQSPNSFRSPSSLRHQYSPQHSRSSSSSSEQVSSSHNTSPRTSVSYRQGPQDYSWEVAHYSYSSSDDSYSSSPEKRTTWLSGSSFDSEELSDYSSTTYI